MREVVLLVPAAAVEDVLDRLLPIVPAGVRERNAGAQIELRMRGDDLPDVGTIEAAVGRRPHRIHEREVSDDWRRRRLDDYEPDVIGGRLVVRPEWAPAPSAGVVDIVLADSAAFGGGTHPTTRTCVEWLLEIPPRGSFADLGCGTGVLAIVAARLGWHPVVALDVEPGSAAAAGENALRNDVTIDVRVSDLSAQRPPPAAAFAANVPAPLHQAIAARWNEPAPRVGLISGFGPDESDAVLDAYLSRGLRARRHEIAGGWFVAVVEQD